MSEELGDLDPADDAAKHPVGVVDRHAVALALADAVIAERVVEPTLLRDSDPVVARPGATRQFFGNPAFCRLVVVKLEELRQRIIVPRSAAGLAVADAVAHIVVIDIVVSSERVRLVAVEPVIGVVQTRTATGEALRLDPF